MTICDNFFKFCDFNKNDKNFSNSLKLMKNSTISQINSYDYKVVTTYVLLKIQSGHWKINDPIMSENYLSLKLNCSKTKIHNIMLRLRNANIINSIPCKSWLVSDYTLYDSILNLDFYDQPFDFRISISQAWSRDERIVVEDQEIFNEIKDSELNLSIEKNMFFCKKVFYIENTTKKTCVIKYGFVRHLFFNFNSESHLIKNNVLKFLATNGHAIFKRIKKIKFNFNKNNSDEIQPIVKIYEIIYNQNNEAVLIIKKSCTHESDFDKLVYTYKIY